MEKTVQAIKDRHSVRSYLDKPIEESVKNKLIEAINTCEKDSNLTIQLMVDEPQAFNSFFAHYGKFENVRNYIVLAGNKNDNKLDEKCGYYGEKLVIEAQALGLNSCWVGLSYGKKKIPLTLKQDEKIVIVIALGYGSNNGVTHKTKAFDDVSNNITNVPDWYKKGIELALLAPTAINQQKFRFTLANTNEVKLIAKRGLFSKIDLGIVKYHFEIGAGLNNFTWKEQ